MTVQGVLFRNNEVTQREPLNEEERLCAVALSIISSPSNDSLRGQLATCMPSEIFARISEFRTPVVQPYLAAVYPSDPLEAAKKIIDASRSASIQILTYWDDFFPGLLREIHLPPLVLYLRGALDAEFAVAVVGTRNSCTRSSAHARRIAGELASSGFTVVSGMAVGIDREAHLGALDSSGKTVGVLANGIDIVYPASNRDLYRAILGSEGSGLISEYPPRIRAGKWTFVRRNRIISGLCPATIVVKAGIRSGALITARHAIDQNREVFACAGNSFDEEYAGCQLLIRNGATLVSTSEDILTGLTGYTGYRRSVALPVGQAPRLNECKKATGAEEPNEDSALIVNILCAISKDGCDIDSLVRTVELPPSEVNEAVMSLEIAGRIARHGNFIWRL